MLGITGTIIGTGGVANTTALFGGGACGGTNGSVSTAGAAGGGNGGVHGGGAGGPTVSGNGTGGRGAVRIIWPGTARSFPSTNTGNL